MPLPLCAVSVTTANGGSDEVSYVELKKKSGSEVVMHFCNPSTLEADQWQKSIIGF